MMRAKILNASAGSGKTYQLAYEYVRDVVAHPERYRNILAVTFTNKATEEMKSRILGQIHLLASGGESVYRQRLVEELQIDEKTLQQRASAARSHILHDYSRFTILTIDTFFQRILRAFIKELGIELHYNIQLDTDPILDQSADALVDELTENRDLQRWLTDFVQERIDEGKKWDIRDGILTLKGELFKERNRPTITASRSREELAQIVRKVTAQAEKSKAQMQQTAGQAVQIIAEAGASIDDFYYKSTGFAAWFYAVAAGTIAQYGKRVEAACNNNEVWGKAGTMSQNMRPQLQPLLRSMCEQFDRNIRAWNTATLLRETYRSFALLTDLDKKVRQLCEEQNLMLLSETKEILAKFITDSDAPFIYEKTGNRFDKFMIDEFQDTSVREWENFLPLLRNAMAQSAKPSVLLVGDVKQSIYRWRGGDWRILHEGAQKALGEAETEVVSLRENWRSLPAVVDFNNRTIERVVEADNRALNELLDKGATPELASELRDTLQEAYRDVAQTPRRKSTRKGYVSVTTYDDKDEPPVVERICTLLDKGFRPCDILILVRKKDEGTEIAAQLLDFKAQNTDPRYRFDVMTQEALIIGNAPVSGFIVAVLHLALDADRSIDRAVYNHYLTRPFDAALPDDEQTFVRSICLLSPEEAFELIVMQYYLQHRKEEIAYLQAIHEQIIAFCANKIADIPLFLAWWEETGCKKSLSIERSATAIEIMTIHKAKGLERAAVIIPCCSWDLNPKASGKDATVVWATAENTGEFPVKYKLMMSESDFAADYYRETVYAHVDNINLLYVALTRAAESLHIFVPERDGKPFGIGALLLDSLDGSSLENESFEFGEFAAPDPDSKGKSDTAEHIVLTDYPTARADLRLRLPSARYFEDADKVQLAPRNFGILMHKAFAQADDAAQIFETIAQMQADGLLSATETENLRVQIERALAMPEVAAWFDGSWERVRNENNIILPVATDTNTFVNRKSKIVNQIAGQARNDTTQARNDGQSLTRRPDRVMIRGTYVVAVDYKFGEHEREEYDIQMREYLQLLREMGYTQTEGYIWYVKLGRVIQIDN